MIQHLLRAFWRLVPTLFQVLLHHVSNGHGGNLDWAAAQVTFTYEPTVSIRGSTAVIDGCRLLLTPLRHSVVPPPMCTCTVQLPAVATCVAFRDLGSDEVRLHAISHSIRA